MADNRFAQIHMSYAELYTDIGDFTLTSMRKQAIKNRRYYDKVATCTSGTQSGDSESVYVDVPL